MCWDPRLIVLIVVTTVVHYFAALLIERLNNEEAYFRLRRLILIGSVTFSIGILFIYKYFNFFSVSVGEIFKAVAIPFDPVILNIALPLGISFYTFQTLSYTIDVYRGNICSEKHFGYFALYISYFPRIVMGPIERAGNLLPQFKKKLLFDYDNITYGLKLMAIGFFKKLVVADTLAKGVNIVYNNVNDYSGFVLVAATIMFTFQIYCDFSGYSDIAIGCAKTMGINLTQNFRSPYLSASFKEFWSRWHITLSTWFRDYVYIPLGGNRVSEVRSYFNLIVTFLLSGLWHGAAWTFVIWGGLHGVFQVIEKIIRNRIPENENPNSNTWSIIKHFLAIATTFLLVSFAWLFFRANSIADAIYVIQNMFVGINDPFSYILAGISTLSVSKLGLLIIIFEMCVLFAIDIIQNETDVISKTSTLPLPVRWTIYLAFCSMIVALSSKGTAASFIYIQF